MTLLLNGWPRTIAETTAIANGVKSYAKKRKIDQVVIPGGLTGCRNQQDFSRSIETTLARLDDQWKTSIYGI